jgi:hypothetical protein
VKDAAMSDDYTELLRSLNRLFWALTVGAVAFLGLGYLLHRMEIAVSPAVGSLRAWGVVLLVLSAVLGVALPILLRTLFNKRAVDARQVSLQDFTAHQKRLMVISISACYLAGVAYLLVVAKLFQYGSVLCGLYGIYSAIPQERKLKGEMRFYGLL